ncbi:HugZ family heme oxygenase [Helicobacter jaachi]|uniref:HugZ family heme oxygenase n=1 Tax=Helicobacter jaachi TaxID=1677920 RepID=A0A4U8TBJ5_9HELI|nr:HugZ family heme oxygenase [Helicobacter jaachi]TLD97265.1 HugZ family heme oxygenase [Helicobacter jaachi]
MNPQSIIQHMNDHHQAELIGLCKKYGEPSALINGEVQNAVLKGVDFEGLDIVYNDNVSLRVEFPQKASESTLKDAIIALCQWAEAPNASAVAQEIAEFKKTFGSIIIASIDKSDNALISYAPLIQIDNKAYIYISEVADHYQSISANPNKIEVMFLEDECKAKSVILRKRLKYRAHARFVERESQEFEHALNALESAMGGAGGVKTIRQMTDFHLVELQLGLGRFVKGFGQAYDILPSGEIKHVGGSGGNPHSKAPHGHGSPHGHGGHNPHKH